MCRSTNAVAAQVTQRPDSSYSAIARPLQGPHSP